METLIDDNYRDRKFNNGDYVKSYRFKGIVLRVIGPSEIEPNESWFVCDHEYDSYCGYCNGEDYEPKYSDTIYDCYMVGDDGVYQIDEEDLELFAEDDVFCIECGQIGCAWHTLTE